MPRADQIVSSNSFALAAFVRRYGGDAIDLGIVPDNIKAISRAVRKAAGADILLTTGGASVGDHDLVQAALKAEGIELDFWKIALRPGKPLMAGHSLSIIAYQAVSRLRPLTIRCWRKMPS